MWRVQWDQSVHKQIHKLPDSMVGSFYDWVNAVEQLGMERVRILPGYHDEKLRGQLRGLRSVRISKAYRVLYYEIEDGLIKVAQVTRISKHDYKA